jgi:hypothetical protein
MFAAKLEILGRTTEHAADANFDAGSEEHISLEYSVRRDNAAVCQLAIRTDYRERPDFDGRG